MRLAMENLVFVVQMLSIHLNTTYSVPKFVDNWKFQKHCKKYADKEVSLFTTPNSTPLPPWGRPLRTSAHLYE